MRMDVLDKKLKGIHLYFNLDISHLGWHTRYR